MFRNINDKTLLKIYKIVLKDYEKELEKHKKNKLKIDYEDYRKQYKYYNYNIHYMKNKITKLIGKINSQKKPTK